MEKRQVLLLCEQPLLGEGLEQILNNVEDVELIGSWALDEAVLPRLSLQPLDLLIVAEGDPPGEQVNRLMGELLEVCPELPIVRVTLARKDLRIYTSQRIPARSADLIDLIHHLPLVTSGTKEP